MITVADILSLAAFTRYEMLAPVEGGMAREVNTIGIMDSAPGGEEYDDFFAGNFVITNLGFARTDPALAERSLCAIMRCDVAAVAVRTPYDVPISPAAIEESARLGVPLFRCDGAYLEEVSFQALSLIHRDRSDTNKERVLDSVLEGPSPDAVRDALYQAAGVAGVALQCVAIAPVSRDDCSLYAVIDFLEREGARLAARVEGVESVRVCRYHHAVLAVASFSGMPGGEAALGDAGERARRRSFSAELASCASSLGALRCGVSEVLPFTSGHVAIREALIALASLGSAIGVAHWEDLNRRAFLAAVAYDPLFQRASEVQTRRLEAYDAATSAGLVRTAKAFAVAYGDVKQTALALDQHPNTVRYRLRKIKAVLGMEDASDRELARFLGFVYMLP